MRAFLYATTVLAAVAFPLSGGSAAGKDAGSADRAAQGQTQPGTAQTGAAARDWESAETFGEREYGRLDGRVVENLRGQQIGEVEDVVAGLGDNAPYAVVAVGGWLGMGEKKVAVPVDQFRRDRTDSNIVLMSEKSEAELEAMPEYDTTRYGPYDPKGSRSP